MKQLDLEENITDYTPLSAMKAVPAGGAYEGQIYIKVSEKSADKISDPNTGVVQLSHLPSAFDRACAKVKATHIERLFPYAGKYEGRTRRNGLHRWFAVKFDKSVSVRAAMSCFASVEDVDIVEFVPIIEPNSTANSFDLTQLHYTRKKDMPFNDPDLIKQWHYNNEGQYAPGAVMGADINLFRAWEITTGNPNVIVCVVDGGVDVTHPDLVDNIWTNELELYGEPNVDDDGNGVIDDINGYCFVIKSPDIKPDEYAHGTHVAGTVAASNNNNIGVCGVAGGDFQKGKPGVKIMSAAIFREGASLEGNAAAAIKYGADSGAVISQNSWTYPPETGVFEIPKSLKEAIDYFVKYAGCDDNGNQLPNSPMKGGIVFFAAGNYNKEYTAQPASYENVIAVTAMGTNFEKASYSNYGDWTDIMAPGGDQDRYKADHSGVLSTVSPIASKANGKSYAFYQGTSMACPHVSGIAALVLSKKMDDGQNMGYTNDMLKQQIMASIYPLDINEVNPIYSGKLGVGYIDAYAALTLENKNIAPEKPIFNKEKSLKYSEYTTTELFWTIPKDGDDGSPIYFKLYYSDSKLDKSNYKQAIQVGNAKHQIPCMGKTAGEEMSFLLKDLEHSTEYFYALVAYDRWGLESDVAFFNSRTKQNDPPQILNMPEEEVISVFSFGKTEFEIKVNDPNGHKWNYSLSGDTNGIHDSREDGIIKITIRPVLSEGDYTLKVKLTDELKATSEYEIPFRIITVKAPVKRGDIPAQLIGVNNDAMNINLTDYFEPQEYLTLEYKATASNGTLISTTVDENGILSLKGFKPGKTMVTVDVTNGHKSTRTSFEVTVVEDVNKDVYAIWPLPIQNDLNIWVNPKHKTAKLQLISVSGEVVLEKTITPDMSGVAKVDMKKVAPGSYTLIVEAGQTPFTKAVLKR